MREREWKTKIRTIQNCPEAVIQDGHTHTCHGLKKKQKRKDLPEDAGKEQKVADKHQRDTSGNPWEKPSENKNTVKKDSQKRLAT